MGQQQHTLKSLLPQANYIDYKPTARNNIFRKQNHNQYICIRQYPCILKEELIQYYNRRKRIFKLQQTFQHIIELKQFTTQQYHNKKKVYGCGPFQGSSKNNMITFVHEFYYTRLETEIFSRKNQPFEEEQIVSVLCSCIIGAYDLIKAGFKQPMLSPKTIMISEEGFVKVGEWEFVNIQQNDEQGQIVVEDLLNQRKNILTNYYWPPEGALIIQETMQLNVNKNQFRNKKSQIFCLGMTILQMCLRQPLYKMQTYSQRQITHLINKAIKIRKQQKLNLSQKLLQIIEAMLTWDYKSRISYEDLYETAINYCTVKQQQQSKSNIKIEEQTISMSIEYYGGGMIQQTLIGDQYNPNEDQIINFNLSMNMMNSSITMTNKYNYAFSLDRDYQEYPNNNFDRFQDGQIDKCNKDIYQTVEVLTDRKNNAQFNQFSKYSGWDLRKIEQQQEGFTSFNSNFKENTKKALNEVTNHSHNTNNLFTDPKLLYFIREKPVMHSYDTQNFSISKPNLQDKQNNSQWPSARESLKDSQQNVQQSYAKGFYEGQKQNNMRNGYGVFHYYQGGKYCGNWINNKMHGQGTLYYSDNKIAYEGQWYQDELHGKGTLYNQNPLPVPFKGYKYESFHECQDYWLSYEGEFYHDDKSGIGCLILSNDEKFEGQFKNDMVNGKGIFYRYDGKIINGQWKDNLLIRKL